MPKDTTTTPSGNSGRPADPHLRAKILKTLRAHQGPLYTMDLWRRLGSGTPMAAMKATLRHLLAEGAVARLGRGRGTAWVLAAKEDV